MPNDPKKKYKVQYGAFKPGSSTEYEQGNQIDVEWTDAEIAAYKKNQATIGNFKSIFNQGLYSKAGQEYNEGDYYFNRSTDELLDRDNFLTPQEAAAGAEAAGMNIEDYYSAVEGMQNQLSPLGANLGFSGQTEGAKALREQLIGQQHVGQNYGINEVQPTQSRTRRGERAVVDREIYTGRKDREGRDIPGYQGGSVTKQRFDNSADLVQKDFSEGVAQQNAMVAGDARRNIHQGTNVKVTPGNEGAPATQGQVNNPYTDTDSIIKTPQSGTPHVTGEVGQYTKENAYGGYINQFAYGGPLTAMPAPQANIDDIGRELQFRSSEKVQPMDASIAEQSGGVRNPYEMNVQSNMSRNAWSQVDYGSAQGLQAGKQNILDADMEKYAAQQNAMRPDVLNQVDRKGNVYTDGRGNPLSQEEGLKKVNRSMKAQSRNFEEDYGYPLVLPTQQFGLGGDIGAGLAGAAKGVAGSLLPGQLGSMATQGIDAIHGAIDKDVTDQERSIMGYGQAAGALGTAIVSGGATTQASIATGAQGLGQGLSAGGNEQLGQAVGAAGQVAGLVQGMNGEGAGDMLGGSASPAGNFNGLAFANGGPMGHGQQPGVTEYNGLTHPQGGLPLGKTNNEVEDGEVRWDSPKGESYIFSNRF